MAFDVTLKTVPSSQVTKGKRRSADDKLRSPGWSTGKADANGAPKSMCEACGSPQAEANPIFGIYFVHLTFLMYARTGPSGRLTKFK